MLNCGWPLAMTNEQMANELMKHKKRSSFTLDLFLFYIYQNTIP